MLFASGIRILLPVLRLQEIGGVIAPVHGRHIGGGTGQRECLGRQHQCQVSARAASTNDHSRVVDKRQGSGDVQQSDIRVGRLYQRIGFQIPRCDDGISALPLDRRRAIIQFVTGRIIERNSLGTVPYTDGT